jgi:hypothetical protein
MRSALDYWLQNPICQVHFAGFTSDTYTLQRAGWDISAQQGFSPWRSGYEITLALRNRNAGLYALSTPLEIDLYLMSREPRYYQGLVFDVQRVSSEIEMRSYGGKIDYFNNFEAVDAEPMLIKEPSYQKISEMKIFKPMVKTQEILIGPQSVPEALEYILKLQDPKQKEIREKKRKEVARNEVRDVLDGKPQEEFIAQIISLTG